MRAAKHTIDDEPNSSFLLSFLFFFFFSFLFSFFFLSSPNCPVARFPPQEQFITKIRAQAMPVVLVKDPSNPFASFGPPGGITVDVKGYVSVTDASHFGLFLAGFIAPTESLCTACNTIRVLLGAHAAVRGC